MKIEFADGSTDDFIIDYYSAVNYLRPTVFGDTFAELEALPEIVYIKQANESHFIQSTNTILWDPTSALKCRYGGGQSPALGLGHEAEHARGFLTGTNASLRPTDNNYTNNEEKRVIDEWETPAAKQLGEGYRKTHRASNSDYYRVGCSTCRMPLPTKQGNGNSKKYKGSSCSTCSK